MIEIIDVDEESVVEESSCVEEEVTVEAVNLSTEENVPAETLSEAVESMGEDDAQQEAKLVERKLNIEELMRTITLILSVYNTALLGLVLVVLTDGVSLTFPVLFMIVLIWAFSGNTKKVKSNYAKGFLIYWLTLFVAILAIVIVAFVIIFAAAIAVSG